MTAEKPGIRPQLQEGEGSSQAGRGRDQNYVKEDILALEGNEGDDDSSCFAPTSEADAENVEKPAESEIDDDLFGHDENKPDDKEVPEKMEGDVSSDAVVEEAPGRRRRNPEDPTPEERELHMAKGHLPYRNWCPICVEGRGREDPHYEQTKIDRERGHATVCMDYAELGGAKNQQDRSDVRKILVGRDRWTKMIFGHLVKRKGVGDDLIVKKVLKSISETGHVKVVVKTDGEPAIVQLQEEIIKQRTQDTLAENPPAYDPQANGEAERAVQELKAQLRVIKLSLENRIKAKIPETSAMLEWMIPHASDCINRYLVGKDGRTAFYRVHNKQFAATVFEFGEQVMAKPKRHPKTARTSPLASRWHEATWVGFIQRTNEHVVVLKDGGPAIRCRTCKPRPSGQRWSAAQVEAVGVTPDRPNAKDPEQTAPRNEGSTRGLDFGARRGGQDLPQGRTQMEPDLKRDFRITDVLLEKYGYTEGCIGCEAKIDGTARRGHSKACRQRIEEAVREDNPEAEFIRRRDERFQKPEKSEDATPSNAAQAGSEPRVVEPGQAHAAADPLHPAPEAAPAPEVVQAHAPVDSELDQDVDMTETEQEADAPPGNDRAEPQEQCE